MYLYKCKPAAVCLLLTAALLLTGCKGQSEKALLQSAEEQYGSSKLISGEESGGTLTLEDAEYGFTYHISGTPESVGSDFPAAYQNCFLAYHLPELTQLESQYPVHFELLQDYNSSVLIRIIAKDADSGEQGAEAAAKICNAYDTRKFWADYVLSVEDTQGTPLGNYSLSEMRLLEPEEQSSS